MDILLWLVPSLVVTVAAMAWAGWAGRERTTEVDEETRVANLTRAMERDLPQLRRRVPAPVDRSTGVAVRPSRSRVS